MAQYNIYKGGAYKGTYNTLHRITALITHILTKEGGTIKDILTPAYMAQYTTHPPTQGERRTDETLYRFKGFTIAQDKDLILFN